ncbi:MAG: PAS domain S-box protein [Ferruginibacter sp.]
MNENFAFMLGTKTKEQLAGDDSDKASAPAIEGTLSGSALPAPIADLLKTNAPFKNQEIEIKKTDDDTIFLLVSVEQLQLNDQRNWLIAAIDITEKKKAELSLITNEVKYRSLIEQASDGIVITDLAGIIMEVNKSICNMMGYDEEELIGNYVNHFLPKEDLTRQPLRIDALIMGETLLYERKMQKKDGTLLDIEVNSKMTAGYSLIGFVRDITERKMAEAQLKQSNERFELLAKATNDALWDHDFINNETVGNENLYNLFGLVQGKDRLDLDTYFSRLHPEDSERVVQNFGKAIEEKAVSITNEFRFIKPDGTYKHIYDRAYIKYDNDYRPVRILGVMQDVTGRIKDRQKLVKEKELSDSIVNNLPGIFYLYDNTGRFIRWNKNFETVTGYTPEEIRKMHPLDFFDDDIKATVEQRIRNVFMKKMPGAEFQLLTKERKKIPFYYNSIAIEYEGTPCLVGMGFDVTERKKIEQELLVSNEHMEQKALQLKTSNAELERFAYIVSHDLQEPLRMVSSFLKMLQQKYKSKLDDTGEQYIHFAVDGANRMKKLIMDLLEYSRTGTNMDIEPTVDMNQVVRESLKVFENLIHEQKAVVRVGELPVLPAMSKMQMFRLMQNLVSNALKYHGEVPPIIRIEAIEEYDQWVFSVQDNGIGIEPKFFDRIFIVFQRLHNRDEFSGTGIGLSICKKIVERQGGKIWLESVPDIGSTFYFSIPKR